MMVARVRAGFEWRRLMRQVNLHPLLLVCRAHTACDAIKALKPALRAPCAQVPPLSLCYSKW